MLSHYEEMLESLFHNGRALIVFDISAFPDTAVSEWYKNFQRSVPDFLAIPTLSPYAREILVSMQRETQRHNIMIMVAEFKKCLLARLHGVTPEHTEEQMVDTMKEELGWEKWIDSLGIALDFDIRNPLGLERYEIPEKHHFLQVLSTFCQRIFTRLYPRPYPPHFDNLRDRPDDTI